MNFLARKIGISTNEIMGGIIMAIVLLFAANSILPIHAYDINVNPTMKPISMFGLFLTSVMLIFLTNSSKLYDKLSMLIVSICAVWLQLIVFMLCLSHGKIFGVFMDSDTILNNTKLSTDYYPSIITILCFFIISCGGLVSLFNTPNFIKRIKKLGGILIFFGSIAIFGHIFSIPALYYDSHISNGMNIFTSISLSLCGLGFYNCNKEILCKNV